MSVVDSELTAAVAFKALGPAFTSKQGQKVFAKNLAASAGFERGISEIERVPTPSGLLAVKATFKTPMGALAAVFAFARTGRALASNYASGARGLDPAAVVRLAEKVRSRLVSSSL